SPKSSSDRTYAPWVAGKAAHYLPGRRLAPIGYTDHRSLLSEYVGAADSSALRAALARAFGDREQRGSADRLCAAPDDQHPCDARHSLDTVRTARPSQRFPMGAA